MRYLILVLSLIIISALSGSFFYSYGESDNTELAEEMAMHYQELYPDFSKHVTFYIKPIPGRENSLGFTQVTYTLDYSSYSISVTIDPTYDYFTVRNTVIHEWAHVLEFYYGRYAAEGYENLDNHGHLWGHCYAQSYRDWIHAE